MKLAHPVMGKTIEFKEGIVLCWVIENPTLCYQNVMELLNQINGKEGRYVLSQEMQELKISKEMGILLEPYTIDFSSKKILNSLYSELKEIAYQSSYYMETKEIISKLYQYVLKLEKELPYAIECKEDTDILQLLKALHIELAVDAETLLEKLILYIKLCGRLLHYKVLVLVSFKYYFSKEEWNEVYKTANYEKVYLLLIENSDFQKMEGEEKYIIDKEMCEICC